MRIAIVSCSRSGSTYASSFFRGLGFDMGHERVRRNGGVGWPILRGLHAHDFDVVLHQVRNPWDAIASMPTHDDLLWRKVYRSMGKRMPRKKDQRCLRYWIEWNRMCEAAASMTYRVENLRKGTELVEILSEMLGFDAEKAPELPRNVNSRRKGLYKRYFKGAIHEHFRRKYYGLYCETKELAERYGYDVSWFEEREEVAKEPEPEKKREPEVVAGRGPRVWIPKERGFERRSRI